MAGLINSSINDTISKFTPRDKNGYGQITDNIDTLPLGELKNFATSICNLVIGDFPTFNQYMYSCMYRLMLININEKDITLNTLGANAYDGGDSRNIGTRIERPPYAEEINYLNFADKLRYAGGTREYSTREKEKNDPYFDYDNLYLDDTNKGTFTNKWATNIDRNSILYKTKRIFNENKANTIISQFGTNCGDGTSDKPRKGVTYDGQIRTQFGESHGRNLLTRDAEYNGIAQNINGYMNPYCRVWTHHHKMDRYSRAMRPFDGDRDKIHHWEMFNIEGDDKWGWKSKQNDGWQYSVMNKDTGFINITPSYQNGGGNNNIHSKQCMFSIENLAWKDYDPYAFDQCLSWEQRGPMGGRIMWFPPYDLQFSETASAQWAPSTFIGRGEDIYTYTNSSRTGTLSFIMLTDHPSITDYVTWYQPNDTGREGGAQRIEITNGNVSTTLMDKVKDTDWLRFFAGCDKDTIFERAVPTPLTDEGMQIVAPPDKETVNTKESKQENVEETITARFYVFYPNNYSGQFDRDGVVTPIVYLLAGRGCQKNGEKDIPIDWNDNFDPDKALGYEMGDETISYGLNVTIEGNTDLRKSTQFKDDKNIIAYDRDTHQYNVNNVVKWYYRIDGEYKPIDSERVMNTYDQQLVRPSGASETTAYTNTNYWDLESLHLNSDAYSVKTELKLTIDEGTKLYTLADFGCAYAKLKGYTKMEKYLREKFNLTSTVANTDPNYSPEDNPNSSPNYSPTDERNRFNSLSPVDQILTLFDEYELVSIKSYGNAPNDGIDPDTKNDTRRKRNENLAKERSRTLLTWLKTFKEAKEAKYGPNNVTSVAQENQYNNNEKQNKTARYAYADLTFKKSSIVTTTVNVTSEIDVYNGYMYYADDEEGHKMYKDKEGRIWIEVNGKMILRDFYLTDVQAVGKKEDNADVKTINMYESNKFRYDQEYHFYKKLERDHPAVWTKLTDKLKYFDPAFHSMTPEGFNARLTFLNQCVRQGNTLTMSDTIGSTANNLAFGRAPYCVLRVGDFYNQMIVIDSINIDYKVSDGLQWDLNDEGIGVQPMLARVSINFKFIGGGDLAGPVRRLQNAMSFNYYANTRLYDNRADRMVYNPDERAQGGGGHDEPDQLKSYAYVGRYYDEAAASAGATSTLSGTSGKEKAAKTMDFKEFKAQTGLDKYKDNEDVIREISKYTGVGMNEIEKMIDEEGKVNMDDYSPFADYYNNNNSPSR